MGFDLQALLRERAGEGYALQSRHVNAQVPRMLHAIGFDKVFVHAEGARPSALIPAVPTTNRTRGLRPRR